MVGTGVLMIGLGLVSAFLLWRRGALPRLLLWGLVGMTFSGWVATLAGWYVTEIGRQPYIVYGLLKTADAISPVSAGPIAILLLAFIVVYAFVFGAGSYYILKLIAKGPGVHEPIFGDHGVAMPPIVTEIGDREAQHV